MRPAAHAGNAPKKQKTATTTKEMQRLRWMLRMKIGDGDMMGWAR
jgi:hypothetical protein